MKKIIFLILSLFIMSIPAYSAYKICIDPGHGGSDPGAVSYVVEKDVNLDVALRFRDLLNADTNDTGGGGSWTVYMTRSTDVDVSLSSRTSYANSNGVHRFMSIHSNAGGGNGTETYYYTYGSSYSKDLANKVNEEVVSHMGTYNRGVKTANFYVLKYTAMPAELNELAFVDTWSGNAEKLSSPTYRQYAARGHLHAIQRHYGYSAYDPGNSWSSIVDNSTSGRFSASSNWKTASSNTQKYGSDYRYHATQSVSDLAKWKIALPSSGSYEVFAWWPSSSTYTPDAPYIIYHSSGSSTVHKNQQSDGGKWNSLGTYNFNAGDDWFVALSCWAASGYNVIADAIKFVKK